MYATQINVVGFVSRALCTLIHMPHTPYLALRPVCNFVISAAFSAFADFFQRIRDEQDTTALEVLLCPLFTVPSVF